jgi:hypothetical protein
MLLSRKSFSRKEIVTLVYYSRTDGATIAYGFARSVEILLLMTLKQISQIFKKCTSQTDLKNELVDDMHQRFALHSLSKVTMDRIATDEGLKKSLYRANLQ